MLATLIAASVVGTSLGSNKIVEFDPASGNAARIVTKTSGGSRYSQWTVIRIEDLRNPAASETYSFREFSMGSGADLIHRASDKKWFRIEATVRDLGRVLEMIRVEHVVERPITISESAYRGERESQEIRHKVIHWKDGRVTDATIMIETSEEPEFEFQRITKEGRTLSILSRVPSGNVTFPTMPAGEPEWVTIEVVKKWLSPYAEILFPATTRSDLRGK